MSEKSAKFIPVIAATAIDEGQTLGMVVEGNNLVLCKHGGQVYVVENRCPHQGWELTGGLLRKGHIICPKHGARFALNTGASQGFLTDCPIATFESRIVDGYIEVILPDSLQ